MGLLVAAHQYSLQDTCTCISENVQVCLSAHIVEGGGTCSLPVPIRRLSIYHAQQKCEEVVHAHCIVVLCILS